ncbi:MAG TPA: site-specific integrase [Gemmataceae bacterium]|nr:site-specific integrase [Gemmataceae bacterium]
MLDKRMTVWVQRFKDRASLVLQWIDPDTGKRKSRSAHTQDEKEAEKARADLEYELNHGLAQEPSKMAWDRFRELYEDEKLTGRRRATAAKAGYVFDAFEELACPKTLGQITERTLSKYALALRAKGYKPATVQGHLAYLRAALRWAADQKLITAAPKVVMPKVPRKKTIRKIVAEEFERLLMKAPDRHWAAFIATAWYTGMRRNEMLDLTWDKPETPHIDFGAARIRIPAAYNKSDEDQWLPLHPQLAEILQQLPGLKHGHLFPFHHIPREVSRKFGKIAKIAGLRISLHDLRRSFGSRYAAAVPAPVLQRLMRHADIKTTLTYYTDVDDVLEEAILKA